MKTNPVGWFELFVEDIARATTFYQGILNLEFDESFEMTDEHGQITRYCMFNSSDDTMGIGGGLWMTQGVSRSQVADKSTLPLIYFNCADCDDVLSRVTACGGKIIQPKVPIGEFGFCAKIEDSEGNWVGLHSQC